MKISKENTVGISSFVKRQKKRSGKTYSTLTFIEIAKHAEEQIQLSKFKEGYRDGVILIPVAKKLIKFFICPIVKINKKTKLHAEVIKRRANENHYISIKALNGSPLKIKSVDLVLYRKDVLEESNERETNKEWELIAFFGIPQTIKNLPMGPVTMMRNQLELPGGTKGNYLSDEWAKAVKFWQQYALLK